MSQPDDPARSPVAADGGAPEATADAPPSPAAADSGPAGSTTRPPARTRGYVMPLEPPDPTLTMSKITAPVKEDPAPVAGGRHVGDPALGRTAGGGRSLLVLAAVVAALALAGTGVFGYLWWSATGQLTDARLAHAREVAELTGALSQHEHELDTLRDRLQRVEEQRGALEADLAEAQGIVEELRAQQEEAGRCVRLARQAAAAWAAVDQVTLSEAMGDLGRVCRQAERALRG